MNLSGFRQRHPRWARFLLLDGNVPPESRRAARWLMSLASLGIFFTAITTLGSVAMLLGGMPNPQSVTFRGLQAQLDHVSTTWIVAEVLAVSAAQVLTLWSLRQLASALHHGPLLSVSVAQRFRTLGNWLVLSLLIGFLFDVVDSMKVPAAQFHPDDGLFTTVILALLCRAVSSIVLEGVRAADENSGFV